MLLLMLEGCQNNAKLKKLDLLHVGRKQRNRAF
jgi:hypothetical protein